MNTPAHLLISAAAFGKPATHRILLAAYIGALAPDASLYLLAGTSLFVLGLSPQVVFDDLYFSTAWQTVFAVDNSVLFWGLGFALAVRRSAPWAIALTGAALLHLCLDFPLHHDDGRPHFWPMTSWVFESPFSYWDRAHGAHGIALLEAACAVGATAMLFRRSAPFWALGVAVALMAAELWIVRRWLFVFDMGG